MIIDEIQKTLKANGEKEFGDFQARLIPTLSRNKIIGVRTPFLRKYAKELIKNPDIDTYLSILPHEYFDENSLHGFLISNVKDFNKSIKLVNLFLPYVDNWATCDQMRPIAFDKNLDKLPGEIKKWLNDKKTYTIRFGIEMAMTYFLGDKYDSELAEIISKIKSEEYYVNMMIAWYFATALAKNWDSVIPYIKNNSMNVWVHNKTIQKAVESYRITDEQKEYLRSLKRSK